MRMLVSVVLAITSLALPAFAQDTATDPATMTCADYMAMSQDDQMMALDTMAMAGSGDMAATTDITAETDSTAGTDTADTSTDTAAAEGSMGGMTTDQATAMMTACQGDPTMMAMDAMNSAMGDMGTTDDATGGDSGG